MYDKLVELTGSFKAPMGCRSFLQGWKNEQGQEVNSGRMNLGVVTVNLPRIALEAAGDQAKFWEILEQRLKVCKEASSSKWNVLRKLNLKTPQFFIVMVLLANA